MSPSLQLLYTRLIDLIACRARGLPTHDRSLALLRHGVDRGGPTLSWHSICTQPPTPPLPPSIGHLTTTHRPNARLWDEHALAVAFPVALRAHGSAQSHPRDNRLLRLTASFNRRRQHEFPLQIEAEDAKSQCAARRLARYPLLRWHTHQFE